MASQISDGGTARGTGSLRRLGSASPRKQGIIAMPAPATAAATSAAVEPLRKTNLPVGWLDASRSVSGPASRSS